MKFINISERVLWNSRFIVVPAVVVSVAAAAVLVVVGTVGVVPLAAELSLYVGAVIAGENASAYREVLMTGVVGLVDAYLLGAGLVILAFGLYELFVAPLAVTRDTTFTSRLLAIRSFGELKARLGKAIILILIVRYLDLVMHLTPKTGLDLLWIAVGVLLVGGTLRLTQSAT